MFLPNQKIGRLLNFGNLIQFFETENSLQVHHIFKTLSCDETLYVFRSNDLLSSRYKDSFLDLETREFVRYIKDSRISN